MHGWVLSLAGSTMTRVRSLVLGVALIAVIVGLFVLFMNAGDGDEDAEGDETAVRQARERRAIRVEREPTTGPMAPGEPDTGSVDDTEIERDNGDEEEPRPRPSAADLPDRGPSFDPHALVLTGDVEYDRKTRRSAAHRLFDQQDYPGAVKIAREILAETPDDVRLHLLVVQSACAMGEEDLAREHRARLPARERARTIALCAKFGVTLAPE